MLSTFISILLCCLACARLHMHLLVWCSMDLDWLTPSTRQVVIPERGRKGDGLKDCRLSCQALSLPGSESMSDGGVNEQIATGLSRTLLF